MSSNFKIGSSDVREAGSSGDPDGNPPLSDPGSPRPGARSPHEIFNAAPRRAGDGALWSTAGVYVPRDPGSVSDTVSDPMAGAVPGQTLKLLYTGRLDGNKDLDLLLDVGKTLNRRGIRLPIEIYGSTDAGYEAYLKQRCADECLSFVQFKGPYKPADLGAIYGAADYIQVVTSRSEVGPTVALEAMLHKTPVVSTAVGEVRTFLQGDTENPAGVVVPRTQSRHEIVKGLADAIESLAVNPRLRQSMGSNGYRRVRAHYTEEAMVRQHLALLSRLAPQHQDTVRLTIRGNPYEIDGVSLFNRSFAKGVKDNLPNWKVTLNANLRAEPDGLLIEELVGNFDQLAIQKYYRANFSSIPTEEEIGAEFVPPLECYMEAVNSIRLNRDARTPMRVMNAPKPERVLLASVIPALVRISEFVNRPGAVKAASDSQVVIEAIQHCDPSISSSDARDLRTALLDGWTSFELLRGAYDESPDIIYWPTDSLSCLRVVVEKATKPDVRVIQGLHSPVFKWMMDHLALDDSQRKGAVIVWDEIFAYSATVRQLLQRAIALNAHLVYENADAIVHYTTATKTWIEQFYGVDTSKSFYIPHGIPMPDAI